MRRFITKKTRLGRLLRSLKALLIQIYLRHEIEHGGIE
jgi:hypothetical protein